MCVCVRLYFRLVGRRGLSLLGAVTCDDVGAMAGRLGRERSPQCLLGLQSEWKCAALLSDQELVSASLQ